MSEVEGPQARQSLEMPETLRGKLPSTDQPEVSELRAAPQAQQGPRQSHQHVGPGE